MADDLGKNMYYDDRDTEGQQRYYANPPGQGASVLAQRSFPLPTDDPSGDIAGVGHALPIPRATIPDYVPPAPEPLPPSAGFAGTGGQIANIAGNLLRGFMAGRQVAQARRDQQANQIGASAWADYVHTAAIASNPDLPEEVHQAAIKLLPKKAQAYSDFVRAHEPQDQPHRSFLGKVAHAAGSAFTTHNPVLFPKGASENALPTGAIPQTPAQQAGRAAAQNALAAQTGPIKSGIAREGTIADLQQQRDGLIQELTQARGTGDKAKEADIQSQIRNIETRAQGLQQTAIVPGALEAHQAQVGAAGAQAVTERQKFEAQQGALNRLSQPGTRIWDMSDADKVAMGINPESAPEVDAYMGMVGKPGGFTSNREAIIAMNLDKAKAMSTMYGFNSGRGALPQIAQAIRVEHPDWTQEQVADEALRRYRPTGDEKTAQLTPEKAAEMRGQVANEVVSLHPELKSFFKNVSSDPKKPDWVFDSTAQPATHWLWADESPQTFAERKNSAMENLWVAGKNYGISDQQLTQMFGARPSSLGAAPAAGTTPAGGGPAAGGKPAAPPAQQAKVQWSVTDPQGNATTLWMTPTEQQAYAGKFPGGKWAQVAQPAAPAAPSKPVLPKPPFDMKYTRPIAPVAGK